MINHVSTETLTIVKIIYSKTNSRPAEQEVSSCHINNNAHINCVDTQLNTSTMSVVSFTLLDFEQERLTKILYIVGLIRGAKRILLY